MTQRHLVRIVAHGGKLETVNLASALAEVCALSGLVDDAIELRPTFASGDAHRLAREAAERGVSRVIALGGDGMVNEVLGGLLAAELDAGQRPTLGIIPVGTANDFATSAGIPAQLRPSLEVALTAETQRVDVGFCGDRPFLNMTSGGTLSEITAAIDPRLKEWLGGLAYAVAGLRGLLVGEPIELEFSAPNQRWAGRAWALAIGNARAAGGGFELCPSASIRDGQLDVTVIPETIGFNEGVRMVEQRSVVGVEGVVRVRSEWIKLRAASPLHLNVDGEPLKATSIDLRVEAGGLGLALAPDSPLLEPETSAPGQA